MANSKTSGTLGSTAATSGRTTSKRNLGDYFVFLFQIAAVLAGIAQILLWNVPPVEAFLLAYLVCVVGLQGLWAFLGHYFRPDEVASFIGWPAGNPFQREVAFANLSYGIVGLLCLWFRGGFWIAASLGISVFMLGAAFGHVKGIRETQNRSPGNSGAMLLTDILTPVILLILVVLYTP